MLARAVLSCLAVILSFGCGSNDATVPSRAGNGNLAADYPKPCPDLYDPNAVPLFELQIAPEQLALLEQDCAAKVKQYRPATFKYGAETASVMVRVKGNWSWRCTKKQFLISFNETDPAARFHGLRKLVLDAPWYDPSLVAERLGFSFMRRQGAYWSCVNHAKLMLNGAYYGVYSNVERLDKEYLQRRFPGEEADGNLYDGGVELRTNEAVADVSHRDALMRGASDLAAVAELADLDEAVKVWAASAMLPDPDSYWAGVEINYFLYDHPTRGFLWFPYDMDLTMRQGAMNAGASSVKVGVQDDIVHADPFTYQNTAWGRETLYRTALSDPATCNRFLDELRHARAAYDVRALSNEVDNWAAQIADAVARDPHKTFSNDDHLAGIATLKAEMAQRAAFIDTWLGSAKCPVTNWSQTAR
jgi:hypothetical protein